MVGIRLLLKDGGVQTLLLTAGWRLASPPHPPPQRDWGGNVLQEEGFFLVRVGKTNTCFKKRSLWLGEVRARTRVCVYACLCVCVAQKSKAQLKNEEPAKELLMMSNQRVRRVDERPQGATITQLFLNGSFRHWWLCYLLSNV